VGLKIVCRLEIMRILCNFFRSVLALRPSELASCVYLCLNRLGPQYEGLELGIADHTLLKAVAAATGRTLDLIKKEAADKGDLGIVAEVGVGTTPGSELHVCAGRA
jgi:DNA ligase-1